VAPALQYAEESIDAPALLALHEREQDIDLRMYAIVMMGEIRQLEPVLPTLLDALEDGNYDIQQAALDALQKHERLLRGGRERRDPGSHRRCCGSSTWVPHRNSNRGRAVPDWRPAMTTR
jgi:hypothetical protein